MTPISNICFGMTRSLIPSGIIYLAGYALRFQVLGLVWYLQPLALPENSISLVLVLIN